MCSGPLVFSRSFSGLTSIHGCLSWLESPKLDTVFQMQSHKRALPDGYTPNHTAQCAVDLLYWLILKLVPSKMPMPYPQSFFAVYTQVLLLYRDDLSRVQDFIFAFDLFVCHSVVTVSLCQRNTLENMVIDVSLYIYALINMEEKVNI